jgi:hypothetical protein
MSRARSFILACSALFVLSGCSAQWHLKQAVRKDPTLSYGRVLVWDTIIEIRERRIIDTLELYKDTTIYQDRVKLELRYLPGKRIMIAATCPPDTITITKTIQPDIAVVKENNHWRYAIPVLLIGLLMAWGLLRNR